MFSIYFFKKSIVATSWHHWSRYVRPLDSAYTNKNITQSIQTTDSEMEFRENISPTMMTVSVTNVLTYTYIFQTHIKRLQLFYVRVFYVCVKRWRALRAYHMAFYHEPAYVWKHTLLPFSRNGSVSIWAANNGPKFINYEFRYRIFYSQRLRVRSKSRYPWWALMIYHGLINQFFIFNKFPLVVCRYLIFIEYAQTFRCIHNFSSQVYKVNEIYVLSSVNIVCSYFTPCSQNTSIWIINRRETE